MKLVDGESSLSYKLAEERARNKLELSTNQDDDDEDDGMILLLPVLRSRRKTDVDIWKGLLLATYCYLPVLVLPDLLEEKPGNLLFAYPNPRS